MVYYEARDEILRHAKRIANGELRWVRRKPYAINETCVGYWIENDICVLNSLSVVTQQFLHAEAEKRGKGTFQVWNDNKCKDAAEAVEFLEAAAGRAG